MLRDQKSPDEAIPSTVGTPDSTAPFISIRQLSKSFGATRAIDALDLDIPKGQLLVLLGPSGCGKTTTMRCIVGLEEADAGTITVDGDVVFDASRRMNLPPNKRNMGMVFQSYALWPHKSVFGNVAFPLQMQGVKRAEVRERTLDALALVGLDGFHKRQVPTLSGGQMQRVALARSLVTDPAILLLDEPLSNLDAKLRVYLRHELKEIQERVGVTTVYVTHDQEEALGLADRILVLDEGRIAQDGDPESLYERPANAYVADFLGMSNQFAGQVLAGEPGEGMARARLDDGSLELVGWDRRSHPASSVAICIRPEHIIVHRQGAGTGSNRFDGVVLSSQYQGSHVRYHVRLDDGPMLFADGAVTATERVAPGGACTVTIDPGAVALLDGRSGSEG